jgi:hypothetical protein
MGGTVTLRTDRDLYAHRLAWDLYVALERRKDRRAHKLLLRIMGKEVSQAADSFLDPWSTPDGLAELRREIEAAQGPPKA